MKRFDLMMLLFALLAAPGFAQQPPGAGDSSDGAPTAMRQRLERSRDEARTRAMAALSQEHQAQVGDLLTLVKTGGLTDLRDIAHKIDAVLSPNESQAVLAAHAKMIADMRASFAGSGPPQDGMPGPDPAGGPPPDGGRRLAGRAMRDDAGFDLLLLSLNEDQMRSLFETSRPPR